MSALSEIVKRHKPTCVSFHDFSWISRKCNCSADEAAAELAAKDAALEICVMFLTNVNTIIEEKQTELVKHLRTAGMVELADAVAVGGIASIFNEAQ